MDAAGALIPNATVTIKGPTGELVVTTNQSGEFEIQNLTPANYQVKAEQSGFKAC
jgi:hypothetical protein